MGLKYRTNEIAGATNVWAALLSGWWATRASICAIVQSDPIISRILDVDI